MKLIPRLKPRYSYRELLAAFNIFGSTVNDFEAAFAIQFECEYAHMFAYGRSGLKALLEVWGLEDVEVICPAYTCVVVPHAIVLSKNKPVFVDCESGGCNMSLSGIRELLCKDSVVVATHLFGYPMDLDSLEKIIEEAEKLYNHKIYVIQDCAHSYGCRWNGELVTKRETPPYLD